MQTIVSPSTHGELLSEPLPRPCATAIGQLTYVNQWTKRHVRNPSRRLSRLGYDDRDQQVEREGAEPHPEGAV